MGVNASTLCSSAPRRFLEDVWIARLATTEFATEEEVRLLLEEMLRFEGAAEPEMTALVLTVRFFSGGATLPIMLDSEFEVRQFLLGYQKDEEQEKQYAEEEKEEEEDDHDDDDDDELGFRGADGVLFLSSDVFLEAAPAPIPAPAAVDFPKELIIAASCLAAHCMSPLQLVALPVPVQMALLPSLLQEPQLAGKLDSSLVRLASHCAQSGMRVSPTWLPHLLSIEELKDTVRLFDACPVFVTSTNQVNPFDGSVLRQVVAVKQFVSGHAPTLIRCVSDGSQDQLMVLKRDNLTTDFACISCFRVFNFLWELSGLGVKTRVFGVVPLTPDLGLMEFVGDSEPLTSWNIKEAIIKFSSQTLNEFLDSAAGSFVACFVLGIRDRHRDKSEKKKKFCFVLFFSFFACLILIFVNSIMIQSGHLLWQLDFKHVFNRTTTGVDAPRFAVPRGQFLLRMLKFFSYLLFQK